MIAALADDLTGAAEIAGIGWRYGLRAEILHRDEPVSRAELVVFDTNSRHCSTAEARFRVTTVLKRLAKARPAWFYKKIDSVLRGNVVAEVEAALAALDLKRCLIVSANPSGGRIVRDGRYFIHGVPLDHTDFRRDPKHPRTSSRVLDLVGRSRRWAMCVQHASEPFAGDGITIGEAQGLEEVGRWAGGVRESILPVGGGEFFAALLESRGLRPDSSRPAKKFGAKGSTLFVSGSLAEASMRFIEGARARCWPVLLMPDGLLRTTASKSRVTSEWAGEVAKELRCHRQVVMATGRAPLPGRGTPARLGRVLTDAVVEVLRHARPAMICAEGGATAALIIERMGWKRLSAEREWRRGVTALRPGGRGSPWIVCKPGSYEWPEELLV